ncbi:helix-turn-helix domain-containing protein [Streptomyces anulatus]|uniref:helix-turn-helix domain-containing protein n=1 Tax=Streptomyces anulatus TaxID=1892 RepID=UPI000B149806|nr:winged helix-turn-helix domain-containing protein [Streptomyces anulatus]
MSDLVGDTRHLSPSAQEALRLRAVAALVAGRDREDVAAVFGVSLKAVDMWWAKWQAGGREALLMRPRGKPVGVHQVLGEAEQAAVRQAVLDHRPCDVGLSGQLWTRRLVGELIAKLYRVRLTEVGVGKYLKRWGLSFQRPDKRAVESGPGCCPALASGDLAGDPREGEGRRWGDPLRRSGRHPLGSGHRPYLG